METKKFNIELIGEKSAQTFFGDFETKTSLSAFDIIQVDKNKRELLGRDFFMASNVATGLSEALCELKQRLISYPEWWKATPINGCHLNDLNVIFDVLNKCIEIEAQTTNELQEKAEQSIERIKNQIKQKFIKKQETLEKTELE